jgi:hypothetical protein
MDLKLVAIMLVASATVGGVVGFFGALLNWKESTTILMAALSGGAIAYLCWL